VSLVARPDIGTARRVVVKVGSSSLSTARGGLDGARVDVLVEALAGRHAGGTQLVLVSSGAVAAGLAPLGLRRRPRDLATLQAAASVGQGQLVERYAASFGRYGLRVGQVLITAEDVVRRAHYRNARRTLDRLLTLGVVPVVNENDVVATAEIRVGDNDRLAALVAHLVSADALVLLSDVDGLYDGDPRHPGARLVPSVTGEADLAGIGFGRPGAVGVGSGGMGAKVDAALVATAAGDPPQFLGFIVGEIRAWEFGSAPCGWVYALSVNPDARQLGVGEGLLDAVADEFRRAGVTKMRTMVAKDNPLPMLFFRAEGMMAGPYIQLEKDLR